MTSPLSLLRGRSGSRRGSPLPFTLLPLSFLAFSLSALFLKVFLHKLIGERFQPACKLLHFIRSLSHPLCSITKIIHEVLIYPTSPGHRLHITANAGAFILQFAAVAA
jgi:hypothetical protein